MKSTAVLVAGFWLGLLVASWVMAGVNFRTAERVIGPEMRPEMAERLASVAPEHRRSAFRHLAAEINRWMFRRGSYVQLGLGLGLLALVWPLGWAPRALAGAALLLTVAQLFVLTGEIASVGRGIDFLPRPLPPDLARRFGVLHGAYVLVDLVKAAALSAAAIFLVRRS